MVKAIVDNPDHVRVHGIEGEFSLVIELRVAKEDLGKVIGKHGRTIGEGAFRDTTDLLDSRSVVHHFPKRDLLGRDSFVSACPYHSAYTRSCVRPRPGYPHRGGGGERTEHGGR